MKNSFQLHVFVFFMTIQLVSAQNMQIGTDRAEGLKIKAKLDYEKKSKSLKSTQSHTQTSSQTLIENSNPSPAPEVSPNSSVECKSGAETRRLIVKAKGEGCELFYEKSKNSQSQARQMKGTSICNSVLEQMKATLVKTGFVCESKKD